MAKTKDEMPKCHHWETRRSVWGRWGPVLRVTCLRCAQGPCRCPQLAALERHEVDVRGVWMTA